MKAEKGITPLLGAAALIALVLGLAFIVTQTDFIGSTVGGQNDCSFEPYTIDGQQFSSLEQSKTTYQSLGGKNWTQLKTDADLQVRNGVVKARVCELG